MNSKNLALLYKMSKNIFDYLLILFANAYWLGKAMLKEFVWIAAFGILFIPFFFNSL
jgi:hypothetical protein